MTAKVIKLRNTIHWDREKGDKVYLDSLRLSVVQFPFATRQVFVRFANGPDLDLSAFDMDRLVLEYLRLRGVRVPVKLCKLAKTKAPPACDFVVPRELMRSVEQPRT